MGSTVVPVSFGNLRAIVGQERELEAVALIEKVCEVSDRAAASGDFEQAYVHIRALVAAFGPSRLARAGRQ